MMVKQIAESLDKRHEQTIQLINGAPIKWNFDRYHATFTGKGPPRTFICDELEINSDRPFDSLVVAEANNPIRGHYISMNKTDVYVEAFMRKLKAQNANADMYLYTSWERLDYHGDDWLAAIDGETAHFEKMAQQAAAHALKNGYKAKVNVIPMSLALKTLINAIESGLIEGL
jgi:hypothetical protein